MTIVADLHIHTVASDGLLNPAEVVELAAQKRLKALAVTDHDTVAAVAEIMFFGKQAGIKVFSGIEFSTEYNDSEVHILGYCFDTRADTIRQLIRKLQESRFTRMEKLIAKLQSLGYSISLDEVLRQAGGAAPGRPHAARVLVEKGYFKTIREVFSALLEKGRPAYTERFKLTPQEAITAIRAAGGFASWAHPGLSGKKEFLADFINCGLQGIEVSHPEHTAAQEGLYRSLCKRYGLVVTGGSDFHGQNENNSHDLALHGLNEQELDAFSRLCRR